MSKNVLVIDDKPESQNVVKNYMNEIACHFYTTGDLVTGLKLFNENNINLIIFNLLAPIGNGIEFLQQIKRKRPDASIIAITEDGKTKQISLKKASLVDRFLCKSFSRSDLIETFNSIGYFIKTEL
ncbi:MAG: response regulator [Spirochaetaceae bacterium]|nr:response regulator [Spirochaetaceae bacterium]